MDQINLNQIIIMMIQGLSVSIIIFLLFRLRHSMGSALLYITLGGFLYLQFFLVTSLNIRIAEGIHVSSGTTVFFSVLLFTILLIYIEEGALEVRRVIYSVFAAHLILLFLQFLIQISFSREGTISHNNITSGFFSTGSRIILVGSLVLFLDAILMVFLFEKVSLKVNSLFLRILITMSVVLIFDSVVFYFSAFAGTGYALDILRSGLISKLAASLFYSVLFFLYIHFFEKEPVRGTHSSFRDIFFLMTYKQKFKKVLREKKESEDKFKTLWEISPIPIGIITAGKVAFVNPAAARMMGAGSPDDLIGKDMSVIVTPENLGETVERIRKLTTGEKGLYPAENVFIRSDGSKVPVETHAECMKYEGKDSVFIAITDLSLRKKLENQLKKSNIELERKVSEKTKELQIRISELERFHDATIEREFRLNELHEELEKLKKKK